MDVYFPLGLDLVERKFCIISVASVDANILEQYVSILPLILQLFTGSHYHQQHYYLYRHHDFELGFLSCSHWNYVVSDFEVSEIFWPIKFKTLLSPLHASAS